MNRRRAARGARAPGVVLFVAAAGVVVACGAVDGTPRTLAPANTCPEHPCESYPELVPGKGKPQCNDGRCEFSSASNLTYPFRVVIQVPTSSEQFAGLAFTLTSDDLRPTNTSARCAPPSCIRLSAGEARGSYHATTAAAAGVGLPSLDPAVSVPVRVEFVPLVGATGQVEAGGVGLPLDVTFASSTYREENPDAPAEILYAEPLPPGRYLRYMYPEPPFDAYFPPAVEVFKVAGNLPDDVVLGSEKTPLDDPGGTSRTALVRRSEGLTGWRIWLADSTTGKRISTLRALDGKEASVRLDTTRQSASGTSTALREGVDVVVSPPDDWVGVPRLVSTLIGGAGLGQLNYPTLPAPTRVRGLVAADSGESAPSGTPTLQGVPGRISFRSTELLQASGATSQLLRYETTLTTDASGYFATVLPPGSYSVTLEPDPVTKRGKVTQSLTVGVDDGVFQPTLFPPAQTEMTGRAVLSDGRPLADADVLATAVPSPDTPRRLRPRPVHAHTNASGSFTLSLDQGTYQLAVVPAAGSGFPRVVVLTAAGGEGHVTLPDVVVPAPVKLSFTLNNNSQFVAVPIEGALVRVFVDLPSGGAVEVGRSTSNVDGKVEILLAREPR